MTKEVRVASNLTAEQYARLKTLMASAQITSEAVFLRYMLMNYDPNIPMEVVEVWGAWLNSNKKRIAAPGSTESDKAEIIKTFLKRFGVIKE